MSTNGEHSVESGALPSVVEGLLEAKNSRGVRVNGDWFNVSKFKPVELPEVGVRVRMVVDVKGFITSLDVVKAAPDGLDRGRDTRITRLAVLKAAANFLGLMSQTRQEIRSEHVLLLADKWVAWVEQDD